MDADRWRRISALYHEARGRHGDPRHAYLRSACGTDRALLGEVESLLADATAAEAFLAVPIGEGLDVMKDGGGAGALHTAPDLAPATILGAYRIDAVLGRGGMGTVYAAYDMTLHRRVALKVVAGEGDDAVLRARLLREARNAAALAHPGICTIYEVAEADGIAFIAMEYVEGRSLRDRLEEGPVSLGDAVAWGLDAAGALAYAHAHGVVHRDFKAANAIVTAAGRLKIVDFGLARRADSLLGQATTMVSLVPAGTVAGTPYAMAPEQIRGEAADARTDIWAFGVMLYEMVATVQPFTAATLPALFSAISASAPTPLPASVPPALRRVIVRCLEKQPVRRYQHAEEICRDLEAIELGGSAAQHFPRRVAPVAAAAIAVVGVAALLAWRSWAPHGATVNMLRANFAQVTSASGVEWFPSLSPDGKWLVYAGDASGNMDVYLQSVGGQNAMNLTPDSSAEDDQPVFSPDGERIAFRSSRDGGGLFVMGRTGEAVRRVTREGFNPAWSPDGRQIVYATERLDINPQNSTGRSGLRIVNVDGGQPRSLDARTRDAVQPSWSPHGLRIAYVARVSSPAHVDIRTLSVDGGEPVPVTDDLPTDWNPAWSPDGRWLYFASDRNGSMNLWRVEIDEQSGRTRDEPQPIPTPTTFVGHLSIAADGRHLAFASIGRFSNVEKLSLDRSTWTPIGEPSSVTTGTRTWSNPDPSPDGEWVAFYSGLNPAGHLYVQRTDGSSLRQLTGDAGIDRMPHWSPDARWLLFFSNRSGSYDLWKIRPDGSDLQQVTSANQATYSDWSRNGRRIAATILASTADQTSQVIVFDATRPWSAQKPTVLPPPDGGFDFDVTDWTVDDGGLVGQYGPGPFGVATYSFASHTYDRLTTFGEWPAMLPDGRHILFVADLHNFFVVDTVSRTIRKVFSVPRDVIGPPRVTRDGAAVFFIRRVTQSDIWLVTLDAR